MNKTIERGGMLAEGKPLVTKATAKNICRSCMYSEMRNEKTGPGH